MFNHDAANELTPNADRLHGAMDAEQPPDEADPLFGELREALRPEALPAALQDRVLANLDRRCRRMAPLRLRIGPVVGLAAAAALLIVAFAPPWGAVPAASMELEIVLTPNDALDVVTALAVLEWDAPIDETLDAVDARLDRLSRSLTDSGAVDGEAWLGDDNWDAPPPADRETSRNCAPLRELDQLAEHATSRVARVARWRM